MKSFEANHNFSLSVWRSSFTHIISDEIGVQIIDDVGIFVFSHHQNFVYDQFLVGEKFK